MQRLIFLAFLVFVGCPDIALSYEINGELKRAMAERLAADPGTCTEARLYFNTGANTLKFCDGSTWTTVLDTNAVLATPVGTVTDFAGASAPAGWLLASGASVSRATYSALYTVVCPLNPAGATAIGTASCPYGTADASNFYLPDLRGRVVAGRDDMDGATASRITNAGSAIVGTTLGASGGLETPQAHIHALDHDHASAAGAAAAVSHTHADTFATAAVSHTHADTFATSSDSHTHTYQSLHDYAYEGLIGRSSTPAAGRATTTAVNTAGSGSSDSHSHTITGSVTAEAAHVHAVTGSVTAEAAHVHAVNLPNHTGSTGSTGIGATHGTVQPTLVLNKIIKY